MSDDLTRLLERRAALIQQFAADLLAIDLEIGVQQRHNVQATTAHMLTEPYTRLEAQVTALRGEVATLAGRIPVHLPPEDRE